MWNDHYDIEQRIESTGDVLRRERKLLSLTQEKLAEKMDVDVRTYRRYENNERMLNSGQLVSLCNDFDCDIDYLLGFQKTKDKGTSDVMDVTGLSEESVLFLQDSETDKVSLSFILQDQRFAEVLRLIDEEVNDRGMLSDFKTLPHSKEIEAIYKKTITPNVPSVLYELEGKDFDQEVTELIWEADGETFEEWAIENNLVTKDREPYAPFVLRMMLDAKDDLRRLQYNIMDLFMDIVKDLVDFEVRKNAKE